MLEDLQFVPYTHPEPPVLEDWWKEVQQSSNSLLTFGLSEEALEQLRLKEEDNLAESYGNKAVTTF